MTFWDRWMSRLAKATAGKPDKPEFHTDTQQQRAHMMRAATINHYYQHFKGGHYIVRDVAVVEFDGSLVVIYESIDPGPKQGYHWSRPADEFHGMTGTLQKRFVQMAGPPAFVRELSEETVGAPPASSGKKMCSSCGKAPTVRNALCEACAVAAAEPPTSPKP